MSQVKRLCVFCGSSAGANPAYLAAARALGEAIAARGIGLVYGGASVGLMGTVADAAVAAGGEVIGVIPRSLETREIAHRGLTELRVVSSMHERKAQMADLSDGFVALPGGIGTLEELFEVWTWSQLGLHAKPVALLNVAGYYDALLTFLDRTVTEAFVRPETRRILLTDTAPAPLLEAVATGGAPSRGGVVGATTR
ncbi:MAG: TIGR00730 family Rossman fold protein [Steroidobacteraceae bacterium]